MQLSFVVGTFLKLYLPSIWWTCKKSLKQLYRQILQERQDEDRRFHSAYKIRVLCQEHWTRSKMESVSSRLCPSGGVLKLTSHGTRWCFWPRRRHNATGFSGLWVLNYQQHFQLALLNQMTTVRISLKKALIRLVPSPQPVLAYVLLATPAPRS